MINFLLLMAVPVVISIILLVIYKKNESWIDVLIQIAIVAVLMGSGLGIAYWGGTSDTEIWDGQITSKVKQRVSCSHSYQCNCYYTYDSKGNSTQHCSTCYEHSYDIDWEIHASTGEEIDIDRVDRQGLDMPPRWGIAYLGEPFQSEHRFTNYIKANPKSVLLGTKGDLVKFGNMIPTYPRVYDYYHAVHVLDMGVGVDQRSYEWLVEQANKTLGPEKQVNIILVFVPTGDPGYMYAFRDKWLGGKKNDAIVLIGSDDHATIAWADVVSWNTNKEYNIYVRDRVTNEKYLNHTDAIVGAIVEETRAKFQRMHMKQMEWLTRGYQPSSTTMIILFILGVVGSIGSAIGSIAYHRSEGDYFDQEGL